MEGDDFWSNAFDAENAIPENAYLSQIIVVPESSRDLIRELQTATQEQWVDRMVLVRHTSGRDN